MTKPEASMKADVQIAFFTDLSRGLRIGHVNR